MICKNCNATIADTAKFCLKCGTKAEKTENIEETIQCPKCGSDYPKATKFCKKDGTLLQQTSPAAETKKPEIKEEVKKESIINPETTAPIATQKEEIKAPAPEKQEDTALCLKCGTPNPATSKFCKKDGTPLKEDVKPSVSASVQEKIPQISVQQAKLEAPKQEGVRSGSKAIIWVAVTAIVLIISVVGVGRYFLFSDKKDKEVVEQSAKQDFPQKDETKAPVKPSTELPQQDQKMVKTKELDREISSQKPAVKDQRKKTTPIVKPEPTPSIAHAPKPDNIKTPPPPPPQPPDPAKLEGSINRALRDAGLGGVTARVDDNLEVTLRGSVGSQHEKDRAFGIAQTFKGAKRIRDIIFVVEQ